MSAAVFRRDEAREFGVELSLRASSNFAPTSCPGLFTGVGAVCLPLQPIFGTIRHVQYE
jgi:hypothetical protein